MNKKMFKSKMALFGDTNKSIAKLLSISAQRNSAKLNGTGGAEYTQGEIFLLKEHWHLSAEEVDNIFFAS